MLTTIFSLLLAYVLLNTRRKYPVADNLQVEIHSLYQHHLRLSVTSLGILAFKDIRHGILSTPTVDPLSHPSCGVLPSSCVIDCTVLSTSAVDSLSFHPSSEVLPSTSAPNTPVMRSESHLAAFVAPPVLCDPTASHPSLVHFHMLTPSNSTSGCMCSGSALSTGPLVRAAVLFQAGGLRSR